LLKTFNSKGLPWVPSESFVEKKDLPIKKEKVVEKRTIETKKRKAVDEER